MSKPTLFELSETVKKTLMTGGAIVRQGFSGKRQVSFKTPVSPVTQVDLQSERAILTIIRERFPTHGILAEELSHAEGASSGGRGKDGYRWVIDPLDGTVNFVHHIPQSSVSVAVEHNGMVLAGGVYDPFRDELFIAVRGRGSRLNGKKIRVSDERKLVQSLVITGFPYDRGTQAERYLKFLSPVLQNCADLRRFGSAAIDLAWIACGRAEAFIEYKLNPWDVAAGILLVTEAGGRVTDFKGQPYCLDHPVETFASNRKVHAALLRTFAKSSR